VTNGFNYRLDELHAAVGRAQLTKLLHNNERRRRLLEAYRDCLQLLSGWTMPFADSIDYSSGHLMVVVAPTPGIRDKAVNALREARIQSSLHYPCIPDFSAFRDGQLDVVVQTRRFTERAITLPLFPTMSVDQVRGTVDCLHSAIS
jgi:dTDP-4-amino-4,6-dideoxygalactose transaminase